MYSFFKISLLGNFIISLAIFLGILLGIKVIFFKAILSVDSEILVAAISGMIVIYGYFLTHLFEIQTKRMETKQQQYLKFVKALRIFTKVQEESDIKKLDDEFQNMQFELSLFISKKAYEMFEQFIIIKSTNVSDNRNEIIEIQKNLINLLRKELNGGEPIQFKATVLTN